IFFSSRRRHTRWPRDWSSDVCSSDLKVSADRVRSNPHHGDAGGTRQPRLEGITIIRAGLRWHRRTVIEDDAGSPGLRRIVYLRRSEERRVGKECRWRGAWEQCKDKEF